ncbi:DoxX family protein [Actinokineospora guangxiensis]|uniref:DoxX family protein n=1 Tax=Actinokineospora guangxiensis TaxID=1490288 RepID=A0ABW0EJ33_9PSEU
MSSSDSDYFRPSEAQSTAAYDSPYDTNDTTVLARPNMDEDKPAVDTHRWHVGADLGLLVLRVVLGALFLAHGLQKVFGIMGGPGIEGFAAALTELGFQQATLLSWVTGVSELGAGVLLILGLFTPAAASAVVGVMISAIWVRVDIDLFVGGVELETIYLAAGFALLFTGAGHFSLDRKSPWFRRAPAFGFLFLILALGLAAVSLFVLR